MVVGGASGMARATAERIANGGGKVAILDRAGSAGEEVATAIGGIYFECDIVDYEGIEKIIELAVTELGGLDAAVNTAGGGIGKRTLGKDGPHPLGQSSPCITTQVGSVRLTTDASVIDQGFHVDAVEPC